MEAVEQVIQVKNCGLTDIFRVAKAYGDLESILREQPKSLEETHVLILERIQSTTSRCSNTRYRCKYCAMEFVGGPQKIRVHLSGRNENATRLSKCPKVPAEIRELMLSRMMPAKANEMGVKQTLATAVQRNALVKANNTSSSYSKQISLSSCSPARSDEKSVVSNKLHTSPHSGVLLSCHQSKEGEQPLGGELEGERVEVKDTLEPTAVMREKVNHLPDHLVERKRPLEECDESFRVKKFKLTKIGDEQPNNTASTNT